MYKTIPVRPGEELNLAAVGDYLREHLPGYSGGPLEVEQFPTGASNLTYLIYGGGWEGVLRRPPMGPVAPKAHDMVREARLLAKLHPVFPLAPKPYVICDDPSVIGAPFYVMEPRQGVVLDRSVPREWRGRELNFRLISERLVETLVELHQVDWQAAGLTDIGHPEGYLQRQVEGWIGRYQRAKTEEVPEADQIARWMTDHLPASPPPTIVHNDYKLNNVVLDEQDPTRIVAVLDWEMSTVGDPLTDVGALLAYWLEPGEEVGDLLTSVTTLPGFMKRDELLEVYARKSGRDLSQIGFYLAFSYFKVAVIVQQIYFRWAKGQTRDPRFATLGQMAVHLLKQAVRVSQTVRP
ncbi:MAG: phosphotransferase family protein [Bacillota bacterium]